MHIIPAKKGEIVYIGNIRLLIKRFRPNGRVEIGIEAPRSTRIKREEYQENIISLDQACELFLKQVVGIYKKEKPGFLLELNTN